MPRYAAIDIGSNSVRMQTAEVLPGTPARILAADREVTRLGSSVFRTGLVSQDAMTFVCQVLARMAETYRKFDVHGVRAVATAAIRDASNQAEFIQRASEAAGTRVEVISGPEEARLIHLGVQSSWPHPDKRILIIDVGGGSAELILSESGILREGVSRPLGAVRLSEVFLKSDPPQEVELLRMEEFIEEKLQQVLRRINVFGFDRTIATSASAAAVVCAINRIPRARREEADHLRATVSQLRKFYREMSGSTLAQRKKAVGVGPRRAELIVAGAAVFLKVLEMFNTPSLYYSTAGVRDGIIADLTARGVGRERSRLSREQLRSVEAMSRKFGVTPKHGRRVADIAHALFECLQPVHKLAPNDGKLLEAAAYLHDTGHYISDTGHHKHSEYLVVNSDLPGFTSQERQLVAQLCRYHRKSVPNAKHLPFQALPAESKRTITSLMPVLRLADALDTSREQRVEEVQCQLTPAGLAVNVKAGPKADLELWAGERTSELFRQVYGLNLNMSRVKR